MTFKIHGFKGQGQTTERRPWKS